MDNPFKKLWQPHEEAPIEIKDKVVKSIAFYHLLGDVSELFITNYVNTAVSALKNNQQTKNKNNGKIK